MYKVYEFQCDTCGHVFEDFVTANNPTPDKCENCEGTSFQRLLCAPAVLTNFIPMYPGSKRIKAGYQHTHNRPAEKAGRQISMHKPKN